jgi:hypothetical protein
MESKLAKKTESSASFSTLDELHILLSKAPQDKEGAFRISTWKLLVERILELSRQIESLKQQPNISETLQKEIGNITKTVASEVASKMKTELDGSDADAILF